MHWIQRAAAALALAAAAGLVWYVGAGPGAVTATEPAPASDAAVPFQSEGNTFVLWSERHGRAVKTCEVAARRFQLTADQRFRELEGITKAIFYDEERPVARACAGRARQDQFRNTLEVAGGLRARLFEADAVVETPRAHWHGASRRLTLPEELTLTQAGNRFRARRAVIDFPEHRVRLARVRGMAGSARVESPACDYDLKSRLLRMERLEYRAPGLQATLARATLDTRTNDFYGEQVTMRAALRDVEPSRAGGRLLASAALAALAAGSAIAQSPKAAPAPVATATKRREIELELQAGSARWDEASGRRVLEKNVRLRHRDTEFTADRIELVMEGNRARLAVATGNPRAVDPRNTVTGERFTIYLEERRVVVEGGFRVVTRPKEGARDEAKKEAAPAKEQVAGVTQPGATTGQKSLRDKVQGETVITGQKLEYDYRRKNVAAEGNLKIVNRGRTITAQSMTYSDRTEDLVLNGETIRWEDEKGQHVVTRGPVKMNLAEGRETLEVNQPLTGKFIITETEEEEEEVKPAAPSPAPRARR